MAKLPHKVANERAWRMMRAAAAVAEEASRLGKGYYVPASFMDELNSSIDDLDLPAPSIIRALPDLEEEA